MGIKHGQSNADANGGCVALVEHSSLHRASKADFKEGEGEVELVHFAGLNSKSLV